MREISRALRKLSKVLNGLSVPHMLIGGHALPAYGQVRASLDVDLAIDADYQATVNLQERLRKLGYQIPAKPDEKAPVFLVTDLEEKFEVETWTKPDGIFFDKELLRRRVEVQPFNDSFKMFVIGPEDFIVNKLARKDRGVQDEQDVVSVLKRQKGKLDYAYLAKRARQANITELLQQIMLMSSTSLDS